MRKTLNFEKLRPDMAEDVSSASFCLVSRAWDGNSGCESRRVEVDESYAEWEIIRRALVEAAQKCQERIKREHEEAERAEYERLKAKFEGGDDDQHED